MIIAGMQKTSLVDYPGNICSTVFTAGCNMKCSFCHNPELVLVENGVNVISEDDVMIALHSRRRFIDGVCVTGGEPTLHKGLVDFISKLKKMGLLVKLDTNGTNPLMLKKLISDGLVDYVAMDVKGPKEKYGKICDAEVDISLIEKSVKLLMGSSVDHEFRMTVVPGILEKKDVESVGKWLNGAKKFVLQQFTCDEGKLIDESLKDVVPYDSEEFEEMRESVKKYINKVEIRGVS